MKTITPQINMLDDYESARIFTPECEPANKPLLLEPNPYLFIDNYLIASSENVRRVVNCPKRDSKINNPIVTSAEDRIFQPFFSIIREDKYRLWYGAYRADRITSRSELGYIESEDGIHWEHPGRTLAFPTEIQFGASVIPLDDSFRPNRYAYCYYHPDGGYRIALSPDGTNWSTLNGLLFEHNHDIVGLHYDPIRKGYVATYSVFCANERFAGKRRSTRQAFSHDLLHWEGHHFVLMADDSVDDGETQFYAMDGYIRCGDLMIGMVKVLRDDLHLDDGIQGGIGYTALAWTRDGVVWHRDTENFFERGERGAWDHSHAWIDDQVMVNDNVYLYYAGYKSGHKVNRFEERQLGLVILKRDRYVARESANGMLRSRPLTIAGASLAINAEVAGELRAQVTELNGIPLAGFTFADCKPVHGDQLDAPLVWKKPLNEISGRTVQLEFSLRKTRLYAFTAI